MDENQSIPGRKFYVCEHGESNTPCACHIYVDRNAQVMPDDWYITYTVDGDGLTDEVIVS